MARSANYALLGYKYQFLKTFYEILCSDDGLLFVCEAFEDIDLRADDYELRIQCKYHGTADKYTLGQIYKPLLEFMRSYVVNDYKARVQYRLFAHFPDKTLGIEDISSFDCTKALQSKDKKLSKIIQQITTKGIDLDAFAKTVTLEFGNDINALEESIRKMLLSLNFTADEIDQYVLSNGISLIFEISCQKNEDDRQIKKCDFINKLRTVKTILMNKWIQEFCSLGKYLKLKRTSLKDGIDRRICNRTFVFSKEYCACRSDLINFIKDLRTKIHNNERQHINNRLVLVLDVDSDEYAKIIRFLFAENLDIHTGFRHIEFNENDFLLPPALDSNRIAIRGIPIRVLNIENIRVLDKLKPDICYFLGIDKEAFAMDLFSVTCEDIPVLTYNQTKYIFNMRGDYS